MRLISLQIILIFTLLLPSCGGNGSRTASPLTGDTLTSRAELLTMIDC